MKLFLILMVGVIGVVVMQASTGSPRAEPKKMERFTGILPDYRIFTIYFLEGAKRCLLQLDDQPVRVQKFDDYKRSIRVPISDRKSVWLIKKQAYPDTINNERVAVIRRSVYGYLYETKLTDFSNASVKTMISVTNREALVKLRWQIEKGCLRDTKSLSIDDVTPPSPRHTGEKKDTTEQLEEKKSSEIVRPVIGDDVLNG